MTSSSSKQRQLSIFNKVLKHYPRHFAENISCHYRLFHYKPVDFELSALASVRKIQDSKLNNNSALQ